MVVNKEYIDFDSFMQDIIDIYLEDEKFNILCDYELACKIVKKFLSFDDKTRVKCIELYPPDFNRYYGEFVISNIGNELFCVRARCNGRPIFIGDENIVFVQKDFVKDDFRQNGYIPKIHFKFSIGNK